MASAARIDGGAKAVAEAAASAAASRAIAAAPGGGEAEHVGQIVAGVGEQGHRIGPEAIGGLDRDEAEIEGDADREGPAEIGRGWRVMPVPVMMVAVRAP